MKTLLSLIFTLLMHVEIHATNPDSLLTIRYNNCRTWISEIFSSNNLSEEIQDDEYVMLVNWSCHDEKWILIINKNEMYHVIYMRQTIYDKDDRHSYKSYDFSKDTKEISDFFSLTSLDDNYQRHYKLPYNEYDLNGFYFIIVTKNGKSFEWDSKTKCVVFEDIVMNNLLKLGLFLYEKLP